LQQLQQLLLDQVNIAEVVAAAIVTAAAVVV